MRVRPALAIELAAKLDSLFQVGLRLSPLVFTLSYVASAITIYVGQVDGDDFVVEQLAALTPRHPRAMAECLALMVEGDREG